MSAGPTVKADAPLTVADLPMLVALIRGEVGRLTHHGTPAVKLRCLAQNPHFILTDEQAS